MYLKEEKNILKLLIKQNKKKISKVQKNLKKKKINAGLAVKRKK